MNSTRSSWLARLIVWFYQFHHGVLHLPGAGWLLKRCARRLKNLQCFPLSNPELGTAIVDFRDEASMALLNYTVGELGQNTVLIGTMERVLRPGMVLWDIGANQGIISAHFSRARHGLKAIHAFEPNPALLQTLNSMFTHHPTVTVHPVGLGSEDAELELHLSPDGSSLSSLQKKFDRGASVLVPIRQGDRYQFANQIPVPDVIKLDVEGHEPQVMSGIKQILLKSQPVIFFEHLFLNEEQLRTFVPPGYRLQLLRHDGSFTDDYHDPAVCHDAILFPLIRKSAP